MWQMLASRFRSENTHREKEEYYLQRIIHRTYDYSTTEDREDLFSAVKVDICHHRHLLFLQTWKDILLITKKTLLAILFQ